MQPTKNLNVIQEIIQASLRGASPREMKSLYMEQNAYDIHLDTPIFRIFQLHYLKKDISSNRLTFVHAHPDTWGDDYENPLLQAKFPDIETGGWITLDGVVGDLHALSWTKSKIESQKAWDEFSHGNPAVRVETTPRLLLESLMSIEDPWFMLRFYIGLVEYKNKSEIEEWIKGSDFTVHLDSLGQGLACSLMLLRTCFSIEEEVRLICSPFGRSERTWAKENLLKNGKTLSAPFNWHGRIKSVVYSNLVNIDDQKKFSAFLSSHSLSCPESRSCL